VSIFGIEEMKCMVRLNLTLGSLLKSLSLIADPTRVRLLLLLQQEELSVAELQEVLSLPQSNISAQLSKLKAAGLVNDRRSGKNRLYRLEEPSKQEADALVRRGGAILQQKR
jgi:ArsR family transcriptional regulator